MALPLGLSIIFFQALTHISIVPLSQGLDLLILATHFSQKQNQLTLSASIADIDAL